MDGIVENKSHELMVSAVAASTPGKDVGIQYALSTR